MVQPSREPQAGEPRTGEPPIEACLAAAGLPPLARLSWVEVDVGVLEDNARALRRLIGPQTTLGIVVKADGYGHGIEMAARTALTGSAGVLVVASFDEALVLRADGIEARVLVLYAVPAYALEEAARLAIDVPTPDGAATRAKEQNIFEPLRMAHATTRQPLPERLASNMSVGYNHNDGAYQAQALSWLQYAPGGSMSVSATDMAHFMIAHLQGGRYEDSRKLEESTARQMHSQAYPRPAAQRHGLWIYRNEPEQPLGDRPSR